MDILMVSNGMHPRHGGPPAVIAGSARALRHRGHKVTVLSTERPTDEAEVLATWQPMLDDGVRLVFCRPAGLATWFGRYPDTAVIEREVAGADAVHLHCLWDAVLVMAGRVARRAGVPYFVSVHGVLDHRAMRRIRSKWLKKRLAITLFGIRRFLREAAGVIFGSEAEARQSWLPESAMRLAFIPNGARANLAANRPSEADEARLSAVAPAFATWRPSLLCRSRIHEEKGLDMLVEAFGRVARTFPYTGLLIAGMEQDRVYQAKVESLIAGSPARDRIVLTTALTGPASQFLYQACDIFLLPSIAEGFSMALTEALANGRPVMITEYCHMPVVAEVGAGIVVAASVDGIEAGLRQMLALSQDKREAMGRKARALFAADYTWERVSEQLEAAYEGSRSGPAAAAA